MSSQPKLLFPAGPSGQQTSTASSAPQLGRSTTWHQYVLSVLHLGLLAFVCFLLFVPDVSREHQAQSGQPLHVDDRAHGGTGQSAQTLPSKTITSQPKNSITHIDEHAATSPLAVSQDQSVGSDFSTGPHMDDVTEQRLPSQLGASSSVQGQQHEGRAASRFEDVVYGKAAGQPPSFFRYLSSPMRVDDAVTSPGDDIRTQVNIYDHPQRPPDPNATAVRLHNTLVAALQLPRVQRDFGEQDNRDLEKLAAEWDPTCIAGGISENQLAVVRFVLLEATNPTWPRGLDAGEGLELLRRRRCQLGQAGTTHVEVGDVSEETLKNVDFGTGVVALNRDRVGRELLQCRRLRALNKLVQYFTPGSCQDDGHKSGGGQSASQHLAAALQLAVIQQGTGVYAVRTRYGFAPARPVASVASPAESEGDSMGPARAACAATRKLLGPDNVAQVAHAVASLQGVVQEKQDRYQEEAAVFGIGRVEALHQDVGSLRYDLKHQSVVERRLGSTTSIIQRVWGPLHNRVAGRRMQRQLEGAGDGLGGSTVVDDVSQQLEWEYVGQQVATVAAECIEELTQGVEGSFRGESPDGADHDVDARKQHVAVRDASQLEQSELVALVLAVLRLHLQLYALPIPATLPPNAHTEVQLGASELAWTRPQSELEGDIAAQGYIMSPFPNDNPLEDKDTGQPIVLSRGVWNAIATMSWAQALRFSQLPPPLQHRIYMLLHVGTVRHVQLRDLMRFADLAWDRVRLFQMPQAIHLGPAKTGTSGYIQCAHSWLFRSNGARDLEIPEQMPYLGLGPATTAEFSPFDIKFHQMIKRTIPRGIEQEVGGHVKYVSKEPLQFARTYSLMMVYLMVDDPTRVRLMSTLRNPIDRTVSYVGMFNALWPDLDTAYKSMESVVSLARPMQECFAKQLCIYCGPEANPSDCSTNWPVYNCNDDQVEAVVDNFIAHPTREFFDSLPLYVIMRMTGPECGQHLQADMPALQLRKWLSLFGGGQYQVLKHSVLSQQSAWQNAVLVSNTTGTYLGRAELDLMKSVEEGAVARSEAVQWHMRLPQPMQEGRVDVKNAVDVAKACGNAQVMGGYKFDRAAHAEEIGFLADLLWPYVDMIESFIPGFEM